MKRVIVFSLSYIIFAFFVCIFIHSRLDIPPVLPDSVMLYRLLSGVNMFLDFLPALCVSAALLGATIEFSHYSAYCSVRFSDEIFKIYADVMKFGIMMVFVLTVSAEIFVPLVSTKREHLKSNYSLYQEYMKWGEYYLEAGEYDLALHYAQNLATLKYRSDEAESFIGRAEASAEVAEHRKEFSHENENTLFEEDKEEASKAMSLEDLEKKSKEAADKGDWFSAHYYAKLAHEMGADSSASDKAWKELSIPQSSIRNDVYEEVYDIYKTKYTAYSALQNDEPLAAYYTLKELSDSSRSLADDPDIRQYLEKAEEALQEKYFFIDETEGMEHFEDARSVYFSIKTAENIYTVFIQGESNFRGGKYLRGLSIDVFDSAGDLRYSMNVPFAKVYENAESGDFMRVMVKSVHKESDMGIIEPILIYADSHTEFMEDLFYDLPIPYSDFVIVSSASVGADSMYLPELMQFVRKSGLYGFSTERARLILVERLCHPILMLIIVVFISSFAWNYRLNSPRDFRLRYLLTFPFITAVCFAIISCGIYVLRLFATVIVGMAGYYAIVLSFVACIFLLTIVSLWFLARRNNSTF